MHVTLSLQDAQIFSKLLSRQALHVRKRLLGAEHPATTTSLNTLAELHRQQGYQEAEPLYLRALAVREQLLGAEHPDSCPQPQQSGASLFLAKERYRSRTVVTARVYHLPPLFWRTSS